MYIFCEACYLLQQERGRHKMKHVSPCEQASANMYTLKMAYNGSSYQDSWG